MRTWQADDVLDAAVQTLINERCHRAYMHDMRGSLQAIYTSLEVLARSARNGTHTTELMDKAVSLAKRAVAHHEQTLTDIIDQVTRPDGTAEILDMGRLVEQVQQFLLNDALSRGISLRLSSGESLNVCSQKNKLRSVVLGLHAMAIDAEPAGTELHVELSRVESFALLDWRTATAHGAIVKAEELLMSGRVAPRNEELVLSFAAQWLAAKGGRLETHAQTGSQAGLRMYYPLTAD